MKKEVSPTQRMLNTWAVVVIIWAFYRSYFKTDLPIWVDEFLAKPAIFLFPIYYYVTKNERTTFWQAIDLKKKHFWKDAAIGLIVGLALLVTALFVYVTKNQYTQHMSLVSILYFIAIAFASSFSEEILSRGFVLKRLYEESKNVIQSVFFSSFLFFFLHIPIIFTNPDIRGPLLLQVMATDFLLSFAVSLTYLQRRNIIVPIIIHAFYNIGIYLLI